MSSSPSYIVRTTTRARGSSLRIALIASTPLIAPSRRSISVTSGRHDLYSATASSPVAHEPTTSISGSWLMISAIPSRTMRWSSTHMTRMAPSFIALVCIRIGGRWRRDHRLDGRAGVGAAVDGQASANLLGALGHHRDAVVIARTLRRSVRREPGAVVGDTERDRVVGVFQRHLDLLRVAVPHGVEHRFLADAQQLVLDVAGEPARRAGQVELEPHRLAGGGALPALAQRFDEVTRFESGRAEAPDRTACFADVLLDPLAHLDDPLLGGGGRRVETLGDRFELERDADEALEQRVVQLAAHPDALAEDERELPAQLPQPPLPRAVDEERPDGEPEHVEPGRLVEARRNREFERRLALCPSAVVA